MNPSRSDRTPIYFFNWPYIDFFDAKTLTKIINRPANGSRKEAYTTSYH